MSIGILYESIEWSNDQLAKHLNKARIKTELINLEKDFIDLDSILKHKLIVNRIFPSSPFRGYKKSYKIAESLLRIIDDSNIPMINPYKSYRYDISKLSSYYALKNKGLSVPEVYGFFEKNINLNDYDEKYPFILKPDCGGRSKYTFIINNKIELESAIEKIPEVPFITQKYIHPDKEFTTRVEIIDNKIITILKRYMGKGNLSGYHSGSKYKDYKDCPEKIIKSSKQALQCLNIEMGSLDIIETKENEFFIIDVNATSNFSEDNIEMLGFDPIEMMANYISKKYNELT
ncbi:MAG: ATP-grasp domain-containing protein [Eubacteriales bacterium]